MNHKLEVSPISSIEELTAGPSLPKSSPAPFPTWEDVEFLRTRIVLDPDHFTRRDLNWSAVLGIGGATVLSLGIWAALGLAVAQIWK